MSNYRRGYRFENKVFHFLEDEGYFVTRSAGSRGPCDLTAISNNGRVILIQCKSSKSIKRVEDFKELEDLIDAAQGCRGIPVLALKVKGNVDFIDLRNGERWIP